MCNQTNQKVKRRKSNKQNHPIDWFQTTDAIIHFYTKKIRPFAFCSCAFRRIVLFEMNISWKKNTQTVNSPWNCSQWCSYQSNRCGLRCRQIKSVDWLNCRRAHFAGSMNENSQRNRFFHSIIKTKCFAQRETKKKHTNTEEKREKNDYGVNGAAAYKRE